MRMKDALDSMRVLRRSSSSGVHLLLVLFGTVISQSGHALRMQPDAIENAANFAVLNRGRGFLVPIERNASRPKR